MTWRHWLREHRVPAATLALALAAGLGQLLLWWLGPAPRGDDFAGPPRSGYTLHDARFTELNAEGLPAFHLQTPRLERREGDESLYLDRPTFQLPSHQPDVADWHGRSRYGWVSQDGEEVRLEGPVDLRRAGSAGHPASAVETADVTAWPKRNRLETAAPALLVDGATRIRGIGLRADLDDRHLELLDDVHATFPPRAH